MEFTHPVYMQNARPKSIQPGDVIKKNIEYRSNANQPKTLEERNSLLLKR